MTPKKKYTLDTQVKRLNWNKVCGSSTVTFITLSFHVVDGLSCHI